MSCLSTMFTSVPECFQTCLILDRYPDILFIVLCVLGTSVVVFLLIRHGINSHSDLALMDVCGEQDGLRWMILFSYCNSFGANRKEKKTFFPLSQKKQISNIEKSEIMWEDAEQLCLAVRLFKHAALQLGKLQAILPIFCIARGVQTHLVFHHGPKQTWNTSFIVWCHSFGWPT